MIGGLLRWFWFSGKSRSVPLPAVRIARVRSLQPVRTVRSLTTYRVRSLSVQRTVAGVP